MKKHKKLGKALIITLGILVTAGVSFLIIDTTHKVMPAASLINPNASENTVKLYNYLLGIYGSKMLSGQYINAHDDYSKEEYLDNEGKSDVLKAKELIAIHDVTGKYPALFGTDILGGDQLVDQCIQWDRLGGISTIVWHWVAPGWDKRGEYAAFYTKNTSFSLKETLKNEEGEDYKQMIKDIDDAAGILKQLADRDIPVLFRPLHEASGGWFWWGASGREAYQKLWDIVYDRLTNYHHLNNLIWVYNGQRCTWYVGDDKCDIVAWDAYLGRISYNIDSAYQRNFNNLLWSTTNKLVAMSENSYIPTFNSKTPWLFFCTWCREFVCETSVDENNYLHYLPTYNNKYNTSQELKDIYDSESVITLDNICWKSNQ